MRTPEPRAIRTTLGFAAIAVSTVFVCGCPSPNSYGTPRTIPARRFSQTIAAEVVNARGVSTTGTSFTRTLPSTPTYQLRYGVSDRVDIGVRLAHMSTLGGDVKWNFVRSHRVDVAIDPGIQMMVSPVLGTTAFVTYFNAPVLFGFNVTRKVTLVPTVGLTYSVSSDALPGTDIRSASGTTGGLARLGFGVNLHLRDRFSIQPEVTYLRNFDTATRAFVIFGIGMSFGKLPDYDSDDPEIQAEREASGWSKNEDSEP